MGVGQTRLSIEIRQLWPNVAENNKSRKVSASETPTPKFSSAAKAPRGNDERDQHSGRSAPPSPGAEPGAQHWAASARAAGARFAPKRLHDSRHSR